MMKKVTVLITSGVLISGLFFALNVSATMESWVMWSKTEMMVTKNDGVQNSVKWDINTAYPKHIQCTAQIQNRLAEKKKAKIKNLGAALKEINVSKESLVYTVENESGGYTVYTEELVCLPGTVDPR